MIIVYWCKGNSSKVLVGFCISRRARFPCEGSHYLSIARLRYRAPKCQASARICSAIQRQLSPNLLIMCSSSQVLSRKNIFAL